MAQYKSNISLFLEELKTEKPELEQAQQDGRALLWDQAPTSAEDQKRAQIARIKQKAYVYQ
jgi:hypothetical protein